MMTRNKFYRPKKESIMRRRPIRLMTTTRAFEKTRPGEAVLATVQLRRRADEPPRRFRASLVVHEEIREPSCEDAVPLSELTYRSLLSMVTNVLGSDVTTAQQLNEYLRPLVDDYMGAFAASDKPPLQPGQCAIVNTRDAPGEHWTAIATVDGRTVLFDPLGGGDTDPDVDQRLPNNCGAHCCAWVLLWQRDPGMAMEI